MFGIAVPQVLDLPHDLIVLGRQLKEVSIRYERAKDKIPEPAIQEIKGHLETALRVSLKVANMVERGNLKTVAFIEPGAGVNDVAYTPIFNQLASNVLAIACNLSMDEDDVLLSYLGKIAESIHKTSSVGVLMSVEMSDALADDKPAGVASPPTNNAPVIHSVTPKSRKS